MNRGWLLDYQQSELEEYSRYTKELLSGLSPKTNPFPRRNRFPKLQQPVSNLYSKNVWSQIPLYGTSILSLPPWSEEHLLSTYGLSSRQELDKLMELARIGRVAFVLGSDPLNYSELDYLEPILKEFRPPYIGNLSKFVFNSREMLHYEEEYRACIFPNFVQFVSSMQRQQSLGHLEHLLGAYANDYAVMRALGYDENAQELLDLMIDNPGAAYDLYTIYGALIANPATDPIHLCYNSIVNIDRSYITPGISQSEQIKSELSQTALAPWTAKEIGQMLMKKLTFLPEGYQACIDVMARYKQQDIYKLIQSLQDGCLRQNVDAVTQSTQELETVFENMWKDAKLSDLTRGINYGFTVGLGVIGTMIAGPIGGITGVLVSLGITRADKAFPKISNKLANNLVPNHLVSINDFKEKFNVPE